MRVVSCVLLVSLLFSIGCSSSYVVNSTLPSYESSVQEFNELAEGEEAEIILLDSTEITATGVYLSADSLYWFDSETKLKTGVVKSEISKVMFTDDMWSGGLRGATYGCVAGMLFWVTVSDSVEDSQIDTYLGALAVFGVAGALIGFPIGMIFGHTDEYEFENNQQQENSDTSLVQMTNNRSSQFYKRRNK